VWDVWLHGRPHVLGNVAGAVEGRAQMGDFLAWISRNFDRGMTWKDMDWVREQWDGPILVKGVLDAADARDAARAGAQGLVVSNHGGRQLDGVKSSIEALPRIADAVGSELDVLLDGGVRSGLDVLKALSLGAKACLIGRAWVYALAARGEAGVAHTLSIMRSELAVAMILTGCTDVKSASRDLLDLD
jgi:L-lactate dehydrogenase (cytochrome)